MTTARNTNSNSLSSNNSNANQNIQLINELDQLKADFVKLQFKLLNDKNLHAEYELNKKNRKAHHSIESTTLYHDHILTPLNSLCARYTKITESLQPYISRDEIDEIESSVIKAAAESNQALNQLVYFPAYQNIHDEQMKRHAATLNPQIEKMKLDRDEIKNSYDDNARSYYKYYTLCGAALATSYIPGFQFMSIIGMYFGALTAITHIADKLMTSIKTVNLNNKIKHAENELANHIHPERPLLDKKIKDEPTLAIRQTFFSLAKSRHQECMRELELGNNIPSLK